MVNEKNQKQLKTLTDKIKSSEAISERNKQAILGFQEDCFSRGLSIGRVIKHTINLRTILKWLEKDFEEAGKEDIKRVAAEIEKTDYAEWTKYGFLVTLRIFYRWLKKSEDYPDEVRWIKPRIKDNHNKLPEDMLTDDEVKRMINSAENPRDKAIVSILYESGCRIGEFSDVKLKNITFDKYGAKIMVHGKTGTRVIRIISSAPYLSDWLNNHPHKDDPEAPLWIKKKVETQMNYGGIRKILEILAKRAGIKKKINPHNFRHSRATHLANHLTEAQMKEFFGWVQASKMAGIYVHLSGRDVDSAILKTYGIHEEADGKEGELSPKTCIRCKEVNPPTNKYCSKCNMILDENMILKVVERDLERREADEFLDKLMGDVEFRDILIRKIREMG